MPRTVFQLGIRARALDHRRTRSGKHDKARCIAPSSATRCVSKTRLPASDGSQKFGAKLVGDPEEAGKDWATNFLEQSRTAVGDQTPGFGPERAAEAGKSWGEAFLG